MRRILAATAIAGFIGVGLAAPAFGATPPGAQPGNPSPTGTGNHNQSCQSIVAAGGSEPGNAANSPGAPFHEPNTTTGDPGGNAGLHYAGNPGTSTDGKTTNGVGHVSGAVAGQYDVACYHQPVK
jgi:hypothetical protein